MYNVVKSTAAKSTAVVRPCARQQRRRRSLFLAPMISVTPKAATLSHWWCISSPVTHLFPAFLRPAALLPQHHVVSVHEPYAGAAVVAAPGSLGFHGTWTPFPFPAGHPALLVFSNRGRGATPYSCMHASSARSGVGCGGGGCGRSAGRPSATLKTGRNGPRRPRASWHTGCLLSSRRAAPSVLRAAGTSSDGVGDDWAGHAGRSSSSTSSPPPTPSLQVKCRKAGVRFIEHLQ